MTVAEIADVVSRVTYRPGWRFTVAEPRFEGPRLLIEAQVPNSYKPAETVDLRIESPIPFMANEGAFVDWLLWRLLRVESHECREWFRLDGEAIFNPHGEAA